MAADTGISKAKTAEQMGKMAVDQMGEMAGKTFRQAVPSRGERPATLSAGISVLRRLPSLMPLSFEKPYSSFPFECFA